ncbi:dienelactone hydrolase family protein [Thalassotalea sediminis]|uniref:dienelactone hydrolase family protein n=1 Tax=Thalassotalea sediminis TaxID=1759089 RepID=UPI002573ADA8|nr:dienelactone hydrolase family protein [Thalassotalea sediminis]
MSIPCVIVSDIFGRTKGLEDFANLLPCKAIIIDPYDGIEMCFKDEKQAYDYFVTNVGIDAYIDKLKQTLSDKSTVRVIAFSIGASAMWVLSEELSKTHVDAAVLFYGAQIRHYTAITPNIPLTLIFPIKEVHFSVSDLMYQLSNVNNVTVTQLSLLHGFMNPCSVNFDLKASCIYQQKLAHWCQQPKKKQLFC